MKWAGPILRQCISENPRSHIAAVGYPNQGYMRPLITSGPLLVLGALSLTAITPLAIYRSISAFQHQSRTAAWSSTVATYVIPVPGQRRVVATSTPSALPPPGSRLKPTPPVIRSAGDEPTTPYYTFTLGDQTYISQRFDSRHSNLHDPDLDFSRGRASETPVTVYYDPMNPNDAMIRAGVKPADLYPSLLATLVLPALWLLSWHQIWLLRRNETGPIAGLPRFGLRKSSLDSSPLRIAA
jgi:hypothetical protein